MTWPWARARQFPISRSERRAPSVATPPPGALFGAGADGHPEAPDRRLTSNCNGANLEDKPAAIIIAFGPSRASALPSPYSSIRGGIGSTCFAFVARKNAFHNIKRMPAFLCHLFQTATSSRNGRRTSNSIFVNVIQFANSAMHQAMPRLVTQSPVEKCSIIFAIAIESLLDTPENEVPFSIARANATSW